MSISKHHGSCLCGDVQFEVDLDATKASQCNCTFCTKLGATGSIVKPAAFTLLSDASKLGSFTRTPQIGRRFFCGHCHIYCYSQGHLEQMGGDFVSINLNCIDGFDLTQAEVVHWDGRHDNWDAGPRATRWPIVQPA